MLNIFTIAKNCVKHYASIYPKQVAELAVVAAAVPLILASAVLVQADRRPLEPDCHLSCLAVMLPGSGLLQMLESN